ncbi:MAG: aminopeptidase [Rhodoferax sp.]|nr:aminopeptidase [Rhodoferax sp.]
MLASVAGRRNGWRPIGRRVAAWVALLGAGGLIGGCADLGYYTQSVGGHLKLMQAARPVSAWLSDEATPQTLRERLVLAQQMREFAVSELGLPDNASYQRYADLRRRAAVWNVVAAPEFSLTLRTWCFPVAGCVGYRGYFDEAEARRMAEQERAQGLEVSVYAVPVYSTLGWLNWAGGDPLLNTFIQYPQTELARLIFHELAHQVVYVRDDTVFNESFATAVERLGSRRWLAKQGSDELRQAHAEFEQRRQQFRALTAATRSRLTAIYAASGGERVDVQTTRALKAEAMAEFRAAYAALRTSWGGFGGFDAWVAGANNAAFGAQAAYDELVPAFEALFASTQGDWRAFYDAVRQLAEMPKAQRTRELKRLETSCVRPLAPRCALTPAD